MIVDLVAAVKAGMSFGKTRNGAVVTRDTVSPYFFLRVVSAATGESVWEPTWERAHAPREAMLPITAPEVEVSYRGEAPEAIASARQLRASVKEPEPKRTRRDAGEPAEPSYERTRREAGAPVESEWWTPAAPASTAASSSGWGPSDWSGWSAWGSWWEGAGRQWSEADYAEWRRQQPSEPLPQTPTPAEPPAAPYTGIDPRSAFIYQPSVGQDSDPLTRLILECFEVARTREAGNTRAVEKQLHKALEIAR